MVFSCLGASASTSDPEVTYAVDGGDERACSRWAHSVRTWSTHFSAWRSVVAEHGRLAVVLRLPYPVDAEAAFVAAARHGWTFDRGASRRIVAGWERVSLLVFTARPRRVGECPMVDVPTATSVAWYRKHVGTTASVKRGRDGWIDIRGFDTAATVRKVAGRSALEPKFRWTLVCPNGPHPTAEADVYGCEAGVVAGRAYAWAMCGASGSRAAVLAPDVDLPAVRTRLSGLIGGAARVTYDLNESVVTESG